MSAGEPFERWNTHFSTEVKQEVFGVELRLQQDPSSHNLGTTVWDASIVLAKFLEKARASWNVEREGEAGAAQA